MNPWLAAIPIAFFCGSIPFGLIVARARGVDIRSIGSGNIGATNVGRALGRRWFFVVFFLDMLKGLIPVAVAGSMLGVLGTLDISERDAWLWLATMAAPVLGHMFTPFAGFRGGKGVATGLGALLGVFPAMTAPAVLSLFVFLVVLKLWRYVGVASVVAAMTLPAWVWQEFGLVRTTRLTELRRTAEHAKTPTAELEQMVQLPIEPFLVVSVMLAALVVFKHRGNIARTAAGTEPKVGERSGSRPDDREHAEPDQG